MRIGWWSMSWSDYWRILKYYTLGMLILGFLTWLWGPPLSFGDLTALSMFDGAIVALYFELRHKEREHGSI